MSSNIVVSFMKLVGYRVQIKTSDGEYEGTVKTVCPETMMIVLRRVLILPQKEALFGPQYYYTYELLSYSVIKGPSAEKKRNIPRIPDEGRSLLRYSSFPSRVVKMSEQPNNAVVPDDLLDDKGYIDEIIELPDDQFTLPCGLQHTKSAAYLVIDEVDQAFYDSVAHIELQSVIGLAVEGVIVNRFGVVSLLSIATKEKVFLFDILLLQKTAFKEGLEDILQNPNIMKVMHDCRNPSDALYHHYGVKLVNVFDTQVADVEIWFGKNRKLPRYVRGLPVCLKDYLPLNESNVYSPRIRQHCMQEDLSIWRERPLRSSVRNSAIKNVIYLRELRIALLECLLSKITYGTDIYLESVRDASEDELEARPAQSHLLPQAFYHVYLKNSKQQNTFSHYVLKYPYEDKKNSHCEDIFANFRLPNKNEKTLESQSNNDLYYPSLSKGNCKDLLVSSELFSKDTSILDLAEDLPASINYQQSIKSAKEVSLLQCNQTNEEETEMSSPTECTQPVDSPVFRTETIKTPCSIWPKVEEKRHTKLKLVPG